MVVPFSLVLAALVLGLAPAGPGGSDLLADPLPVPVEAPLVEVPAVDAGPVAVGDKGVEVVTPGLPVPLPVAVDTDLALCQGCLGLSLAAGDRGPADTAVDGEAQASPSGPLQAIADAPPAAVAAGGSVLAGLLGFLAWLLRPALGLFSRIEDGDLAAHPLRRQALDLIEANPGATVQDVRRTLGIAWGTAVYHLGRLERAGLVAVRRSAGRRGHWPLGQAPPRDALAPTGQALADLVRQRPGLSQRELAVLAGIGAPAACKQLRRLENAGLVAAQAAGRTRRYVPAGVPVAAAA